MTTKRTRINWGCPRVQAVLLLHDRAPRRAAEYLGCGYSTVLQARRRLGLVRPAPPRIDWGPWDSMLGRMSDGQLARRMSAALARTISTSAVTHRRELLGVASWRATRGEPA